MFFIEFPKKNCAVSAIRSMYYIRQCRVVRKDFKKTRNILILSGFDLISEWNALDTIGEKVTKLLARENTISTEPVQALLLSGYPRHMSDVSAFMQKACYS